MTNDKPKKDKGHTSDSDVHYFDVNELIWFRDSNEPTDPDPAPGKVLEETGDNDFKVEIYLTDLSTELRKHVGTIAANGDRYIEHRDNEGGPL